MSKACICGHTYDEHVDNGRWCDTADCHCVHFEAVCISDSRLQAIADAWDRFNTTDDFTFGKEELFDELESVLNGAPKLVALSDALTEEETMSDTLTPPEFAIAQRDELVQAVQERGLADHITVRIDPVFMEATVTMTAYAASVLLRLGNLHKDNNDE